jgi:putative transposase
VLVLRHDRSLRRRARGLARRHDPRSVGGLRQGVRQVFGRFEKRRARPPDSTGLGPQYIADAWINEVKLLGITITPFYVGEPLCNGVVERLMRTLKEQFLYIHRCQSLAEARRIIGEFIVRYNIEWLIERLDIARRWLRARR